MFKCANVATFSTDYTAFHLGAGQVDDGRGGIIHGLTGDTLHRGQKDTPSLIGNISFGTV
jgi:hypothetical protein